MHRDVRMHEGSVSDLSATYLRIARPPHHRAPLTASTNTTREERRLAFGYDGQILDVHEHRDHRASRNSARGIARADRAGNRPPCGRRGEYRSGRRAGGAEHRSGARHHGPRPPGHPGVADHRAAARRVGARACAGAHRVLHGRVHTGSARRRRRRLRAQGRRPRGAAAGDPFRDRGPEVLLRAGLGAAGVGVSAPQRADPGSGGGSVPPDHRARARSADARRARGIQQACGARAAAQREDGREASRESDAQARIAQHRERHAVRGA